MALSALSRRLATVLAECKRLRQAVPEPVKKLIRTRFLNSEAYRRRLWLAENPLRDWPEVSDYPAKVDYRLGIVREMTQQHRYFMAACRDLGVPYVLIDLFAPDWIDRVQASGCETLLIWPSAYMTVWKQMIDDRIRILCEDLGKGVYPSLKEIWLYESKRRQTYWLDTHGIPHPRTWIFYDIDQAMDFCKTAPLPLVAKTDTGARASGIRIVRTRKCLARHMRRVFHKGMVRQGGDPRDRQWGMVFLQEYLPDITEWRMVRIGDSYFGHQKLRRGQFHSGSKLVGWCPPSAQLLDFVRDVTDRGPFTSMNIDVFQTRDGRFLVNELQALFGSKRPYQMLINGQMGRYVHGGADNGWVFEPGNFCANNSCNLRVQYLLRQKGIGIDLPDVTDCSSADPEDVRASVRAYRACGDREQTP